jgi:phospholipid/cholesterol/gamma-HCH transport system ATP-binding protein
MSNVKDASPEPLPRQVDVPRPGAAQAADNREVAIRVRDLTVGFGQKIILDHLDLDVYRGEVLGFVGGSGTGKSVLTRAILRLIAKRAGTIEVLGKDLDHLSGREYRQLEQRFGVLFQQGALFSGLTVKQNIQMPMREYLDISHPLMDDLAMLKIEMVGLALDAADKYPAELSGGMIKRAALARALALDPDILFLDEPTSGLDPIGAADFDDLIATLQRTLGLTVFMVTHDLDSLYSICDRIAALAEKKVIAEGTIDEMLASKHPWVRSYFHGKRARQLGSVHPRGGPAS